MKKIILFLFVVALAQFSLFSHPHMWFTTEVEFIFSGHSLKGAFITWTFDRFFSADIIEGYDNNKDGKFNIYEKKEVYHNAFKYTKNYHYFIFIRQGNKRESPSHINESTFSVKQNKGIVSYRFFVDLRKYKNSELFFACYDHTFFCDISYKKNKPITFRYDENYVHPTYKIKENKNYPVFYDPLSPASDNSVYHKWKPGLVTYYPFEVKINF